ncbi:hypothetical protein [Agrobacterium tumefaciens]|nr:hypothetical protein [Agrobacterium tumefaciens]
MSDKASKQSDAAWNWSDECRRLIGAAAKDMSSTNFNVLLDRMAPVGATFVREKFEALNRTGFAGDRLV